MTTTTALSEQHRAVPASKTVVLTGSVAPYSSLLTRALEAHGHRVIFVANSQVGRTPSLFGTGVARIEPRELRVAVEAADVTILLTGLGPVLATVDDAEALDIILTASRPDAMLIELSSFGVFGDQGTTIVDEFTTPDPFSGAESMLASEQRTLSAGEDMRTVVVRAGLIYGPGGGEIVRALIAAAHTAGQSRFVGEAADAYPLVHQDDLLALLCTLVEAPNARGIFHAVSETIEAAGLAQLVADAAGVTKVSALTPEELDRLIAPALTSSTLPGRISVRAVNTRGREINWVPLSKSIAAELDSA